MRESINKSGTKDEAQSPKSISTFDLLVSIIAFCVSGVSLAILFLIYQPTFRFAPWPILKGMLFDILFSENAHLIVAVLLLVAAYMIVLKRKHGPTLMLGASLGFIVSVLSLMGYQIAIMGLSLYLDWTSLAFTMLEVPPILGFLGVALCIGWLSYVSYLYVKREFEKTENRNFWGIWIGLFFLVDNLFLIAFYYFNHQ